MVAQKFGKWIVERQLGEGGQAHAFIVYCENDKERAPFVLKRLKNRNRLPRFEKEIKAGLELNHPNILRICDKDLLHDRPYFVAEFCNGGSLGKSDLSNAAIIDLLKTFGGICRGVGHAHDNAVVHRDLKPDNIFLRADNTPVVGDFGLCFIAEDGARITMIDEVAGSRWYTAPELAHGVAEEVTPAADVYSLGKLLYWMLAGKIFDREMHRNPRFDLTRDHQSPDYFFIYELLDKMITEEPSNRLVNANYVADSIETIIQRIEVRAHHLDLSIAQACLYCGIGSYQKIVDEPEDDNAIPKKYPKTIHLFGIKQEEYNDRVSWWPNWLILACDHCGNVQVFRPDQAKSRNVWKK